MNRSTAINATDAISTYISAKDGNRPQLMKHAFAEDCELEMAVRTDAISFPSSAKGLEQITQVLVTNFSDQYENIRTFCLSRPNSDYLPHFLCDWLVGMSARQDGAVRVGCGHYDWYFGSDGDGRVTKHVRASSRGVEADYAMARGFALSLVLKHQRLREYSSY
jgi:hypothetical protein